MGQKIRKIKRLFVANRGEIAVRIIRACHELGIDVVIGVSEADRHSLGAKLADRSICIGASPAANSYLRTELSISAALGTECDAIHPGYGFLSENAKIADECEKEGLVFVGPPARVIKLMGDKISAVEAAREAGVPTLPCSPAVESIEEGAEWIEQIGYPCIIKASAGGGGRGMRIVRNQPDFGSNFDSARAEANAAFGDGTVYIEKFVGRARHVEVQIIADEFGNVCHLFERDCSIQRRHQKLIEEAPSPVLSKKVRRKLLSSAVQLAKTVEYLNAGTIEYLYDVDEKNFYFLEMNTRLQVEHPVTEQITGIDIVKEQIRISEGHSLSFRQSDVECRGSAIECRINAENPSNNFLPNPGKIERWAAPPKEGMRLDTHCFEGYLVPPFYDSLLAKLIVHSCDREKAITELGGSLKDLDIRGVETTALFLSAVIASDEFQTSRVTTTWLEDVFLPRWMENDARRGGNQR
jgi:acetyl-CoA carboxylase biotin carboxylase subunit